MSQKKAVLFFAEGFEEVEGITVFDVLKRGGVDVKLVSATEKREVVSSHGLTVVCDEIFENADGIIKAADALILPGGGVGTENLKKHDGVGERLKEAKAAGKLIAAVCAGPTVFAKLGLLQGETAVCYPAAEGQLTEAGAKLGGADVVKSNNVITSKGAGTTAEFAFAIANELVGESVSKDVRKAMLF